MQKPQVYTAGIDNTIKVWDLRKEEVSFSMEGHTDTITGMSASAVGQSSMDADGSRCLLLI